MSQVLALKYRPNSFDKLIGQDSVTQTLSLALNQKRLSHAYLFSGLRGSGKTSTARIFSKALVCENGPTSTPCETCGHCQMANEGRHIDIIEMDAASSRKIDDIRDLIEQTKYKPNSARYKIFIIDEVHMLTKEAFNALLKTLEEPPEFVKFILATTDPLKLPATILSRTQHFRFKQIPKNDITHHLSHILNLEKIEKYDIEALDMLSRAGNGSLRDTLTLLDQAIIFTKGYITPEKIASMLGLLDPKQVELIFQTILKGDKENLIEIIKELENYECEVIIDELIAYLKESFFKADGKFSTLITERFFRILSESKNLLFLNADNGFVLALLFFKMLEAMNIKTIEEMVDALEDEKFRVPKTVETKQTTIAKETPPQPIVEKVVDTIEPIKEPQIEQEKPLLAKDNGEELFAKLIYKLEDRSHELATCFKNFIEFQSYANSTLTWTSSADEENKKMLKHGYPIIRQFVQEIFGIDTKIQMSQAEQKKKIIDTSHANENTSSMIEDVEFNPLEGSNTESCVTGHITADKKEAEVKEILNDPFVKKVQEMFKPKDIKIYPKV